MSSPKDLFFGQNLFFFDRADSHGFDAEGVDHPGDAGRVLIDGVEGVLIEHRFFQTRQ